MTERPPNIETARVLLEGWNHIPRGYGATFDVPSAPWWLRLWSRAPFVDRYAYPRLVERGFGWLTPAPGCADRDREAVGPGWRVRDPSDRPAGSVTDLR